MGAAAKCRQIRHHVALRNHALRDGLHHIAGFGDAPSPGIHHQQGALQRQRIRFAHIGAIGANQIKMHPGAQRHAWDQGFARQRGGADDIGCGEIGRPHRPRWQAMGGKLPGQTPGVLALARPDRDIFDRKTGSISLSQGMGDLAAAQQQQARTLWPGQIARGEQAGRRRAPIRQFAAIQHGKWRAGGGI